MHFHFCRTQLLRVIAEESICWICAWLQVLHAKLIISRAFLLIFGCMGSPVHV